MFGYLKKNVLCVTQDISFLNFFSEISIVFHLLNGFKVNFLMTDENFEQLLFLHKTYKILHLISQSRVAKETAVAI